MPVNLTSAFRVGELDASDYTQFKVTHFIVDLQNSKIIVTGHFGNTSGSFGVGAASPQKTYEISGAAYLDLVTKMPQGSESLYGGVARELYAYLQAQDSRLAGSVVA